MKVLVTGGAGFIGSHIVEHFYQTAEVVVIDNLRTGDFNNIKDFGIEFVNADIRDRKTLSEALIGCDYVFHLAAMVSVPESMKKPAECVDINTQGTITLLEEAAAAGVKKLCMSSTSAIYGDEPTFPKTENMLPCPKSPYAVTKLDGEYYCRIFAEQGRLETACMRYFNVFGPRQNPESAYAAAVPIFTSKAVNNENLVIYGDGEQTRDFVFVKDVVKANVFLAKNSLSGVYNVGYGTQITINRLAEKIIQLTGSNSKVDYAQERPGDVKHSVASVDKLRRNGFVLENGFDLGLKQTVDFFKNKQ